MDKNTFISSLDFSSRGKIWCKSYPNCSIKVDFDSGQIIYPDDIKIERGTILNFDKEENFVQLSCIDKLLAGGYEPQNIVLEKSWKLGHKGKGFLDILVKDNQGKSFMMIECKTKNEYRKEIENMYSNGGQLFSYYQQEKGAKFLVLYTSYLEENIFNYQNSVIKVTNEMRECSTGHESFESWSPQYFETLGIFKNNIRPYELFHRRTKKDLQPLESEDGNLIFNRFAEILRRNVVSDKTNAYNKIFNLFLCKIVDEFEKNDDDIVDFQWGNNEKSEDVLLRLIGLYKRGMKEYLDLEIADVDISRIKNHLEGGHNKEVEELFIMQKLYTNNEFAFKEVFDKNTFDLNCIVVKEVVKLIEDFQIKYDTKQQFLGDFFERLLNTGIKQESGQYFTPSPIASFICKSLPIRNIIKQKIDRNEINILPYTIDYSSGSGHFLTEVMFEIDTIVKGLDLSRIKNKRSLEVFEHHKLNMKWANKYIYGIEKDYRLAKTTKIATYLNGDGDARIICGDGIDNFFYSKEYRGLLKSAKGDITDIDKFDIVVANPPYSVDGFKRTVKHGRESFGELFAKFDDNSTEIEILFLKRTKQLLREGGVAGIILPTSVLTSTKRHQLAREILFNDFDIKGIIKLGVNTFMATNIKTAIFFLQKKRNVSAQITKDIDEFGVNKKNKIIKNKITYFVEKFYRDLSFDQYISLFEKDNFIHESKSESELFMLNFKHYLLSEDGYDDFITNEKKKLLYFMQVHDKNCLVSSVPNGVEEEKNYLGYFFSNRKGREGIQMTDSGNMMFDLDDTENEDKISFYIRNIFMGKQMKISAQLENLLRYKKIESMFDFNADDFLMQMNLNDKYKFVSNKYKMKPLKDILQVVQGNRYSGSDEPYLEIGDLKKDENFNLGNFISNQNLTKEFATKTKKAKKESHLIPESSLLFSRVRTNLMKVFITDKKYHLNRSAWAIYKLPENEVQRKFIIEHFKQDYIFDYLLPLSSDFDYPRASHKDFDNFELPILSEDEMVSLLNKLDLVSTKEKRREIWNRELGIVKVVSE